MKQQTENLQEIKGDEAVASGVFPVSTENSGGTDARSGTPLTQRGSRPVRYELIGRDGRVWATHHRAEQLSELANFYFPGEEQDPDRTGKGWDIQVAGS